MNVLTFNLRIDLAQDGPHAWQYRCPLVAAFLSEENYEVIGCQEPTPAMTKSLLEALPRYKMVGVPRRGEEELCPILYDFRKVRLTASGTFWLSATPEASSKFADSFFFRICTWAEFEPLAGKPFRMFNTHLDYANSGVQMRQMAVLLDHMKAMDRKKPLPVILTGDFNAEPDAAVHQAVRGVVLKKKRSLRSLYDGICRSGLTFHDFHGDAPGFPIDFIYHSTDWMPISGKIRTDRGGNNELLSDHFPLEGRFR